MVIDEQFCGTIILHFEKQMQHLILHFLKKMRYRRTTKGIIQSTISYTVFKEPHIVTLVSVLI